jgi:hypothetical protein
VRGVYFSRFWTESIGHPFGLLLCPADSGGQSVTIRVGRLSFRLEVDMWLQTGRRAD